MRTCTATICCLWLLAGIALAGRTFDNSEQYFYRDAVTDPYSDAYPLFIGGWVNVDANTATDCLFSWADTNVNDMFIQVFIRGDLGGLVELRRENGTFSAVQTAGDVNDGEWHWVGAKLSSATSATIYLDGTSDANEDTTNIAYPSDVNAMALGASYKSDVTNLFGGGMAWWATYAADLNDIELGNLASGYRPSDVNTPTTYWPLNELGVWLDADNAAATGADYDLIRRDSPGLIDADALIQDLSDGHPYGCVIVTGM
jgi:hypothetical protein